MEKSTKISAQYRKLEFSNFVANRRYENYGKVQKFQLNISKIMPARPENTGTWSVNINIVNMQTWMVTGLTATGYICQKFYGTITSDRVFKIYMK